MRAHFRTGLLRIASSLLLATAIPLAQPARADTVRAESYDAFWLWGGVVPQPVLDRARTIYVLQGAVRARRGPDARADIVAQGVSMPRTTTQPATQTAGPAASHSPSQTASQAAIPDQDRQIWLVYRADTLQWTPRVYAVVLAQLQRWRTAGNHAVGIQIDFDAGARHLPRYVEFLKDLRTRLPDDCKLGITGLLDWSSRVDPDTVNLLKNVVDEVVVQTYQGRRTIDDYAAYLPRLKNLALPFKVGLIQDGQWQPPPYLADSPWFRGYVVFLRNP
jgi:hypothetical protein